MKNENKFGGAANSIPNSFEGNETPPKCGLFFSFLMFLT